MRIGLIDVDGHHFPNLALMRISAWHKAQGDTVEWWLGDMFHYDKVYMSKVFSNAYTNNIADPINADEVIKGGTGYAISINGGGWKNMTNLKTGLCRMRLSECFPIIRFIRSTITQLP